MSTGKTFTGRQRKRTTSMSIKMADAIAHLLITMGGIGTILAVSLVCIFLVYVAAPLAFAPKVLAQQTTTRTVGHEKTIYFEVDEFRVIGINVFKSGKVNVFQLADGKKLTEFDLAKGKKLTAWAFSKSTHQIALGYDDGSVQFGELNFETSFLSDQHLTPELQKIGIGESAILGKGIVTKTPTGQLRQQVVKLTLESPIKSKVKQPIRLIDQIIVNNNPVYVTYRDDHVIQILKTKKRKNLLTGKVTLKSYGGKLPYEFSAKQGPPAYIKLMGLGDQVYLIWPNGTLQRYNTRSIRKPIYVETVQLLNDPTAQVTTVKFMNGRFTLVVGDSLGNLAGWFPIKPEDAKTSDGSVLVKAHWLQGKGDAAVSLGISTRSRLLVAGFANGSTKLFQMTNDELLLDLPPSGNARPITHVAIAPKENALLALSDKTLNVWQIDKRYPAVTLKSIFLPVWYEAMEGPSYIWQSSGGTDEFEPKYGLFPLIFGTLKATIYSMLFGLPIAILAAVYTSEFLHPKVKTWVKPSVELMASLPSVVLGFLAALVIAPFVEKIVPAILAAIFVLPASVLLGAYLWQIVPRALTIRLENIGQLSTQTVSRKSIRSALARMVFFLGGVRLSLISLTFCIGLYASYLTGPLAEKWLFAGDITRWLDGQIGSGIGAWFILLLPLTSLATAYLVSRHVNPLLARIGDTLTHFQFGLMDLAKFILASILTLVIAYSLSTLLAAIGWDPRGTYVDTYVQRNALIVGFVMGFAVIPIIYTIAEDALSAVPDHLRSASLGAGATIWQTATRIIIPTAMSGLFSATMIGLGRAVGETMIVLMAAGNTPVLSTNIFNGFRTLSANIAVELPEAPVNGTHYRLLFLSAVTLFVMTFVLNTFAERVRQRFRKRAFQL